MKKILLILAVVGTAFMFASCGDDDKDEKTRELTISGKLKLLSENDSTGYFIEGDVTDEIDELRLFTDGDFFGKSPVSGGQFSYKLPIPSSEYLWVIAEDVPNGVSVSDKSAKSSVDVSIYGFKNNDEVGEIGKILSSLTDNISIMYIYVDKDVHITGVDHEETYTDEYDVNLKKGWNVMVETVTINNEMYKYKYTANNEPSNMIWVLGYSMDEDDNSSNQNHEDRSTDYTKKGKTQRSPFQTFRKK